MTRRDRDTLGMTLVELMIVVVIIGILAAISVVGYRKYIASARVSEATAMLAEFASKEQLYFLDNGAYLEAHNTGTDTTATLRTSSANESTAEFWPHAPDSKWDSAREAFAVAPMPTSWRRLGIRPRWPQLFCTYMVNAGCPASGACPDPSAHPVGAMMWGATAKLNVPWFYAMAACNLVREATWTSGVTIVTLTHDSPAIRRMDETN
jgi:prepilin-type N-terminal cleavage/methylation domain-containing protein